MFSLEAHGWTRPSIGVSIKELAEGSATLSYRPGIDGSPDAWQDDKQTLGKLTLAGVALEKMTQSCSPS